MSLASKNNNTEVNLTESTIHQLEAYIKDFWRFLPLPICYLNSLHLILDIDLEMEKFSKYDATEIIGEGIEKIFVGQDKELTALKKETLEKGLVGGKKMYLFTKDQEKIPVNVFAMARRDEKNEVIGYFLALSDIRESEKMQAILEYKVKERTKELEESKIVLVNTLKDVKEARKVAEEEQHKTAAIINNFVDPIIVVGKNGKINLFNPAAKEVLKLTNLDLGRKVAKKHNYSLENFRKIIKIQYRVKSNKELKSGERNVEEVTIRIHDEELIYKVITAKVFDKRKEYLGTMKIFLNLTREKIIDRLKSEFISIAAHQLRTPLSAVKWAVNILLEGGAGEINLEQKELLSKAYSSNERMINLVNDMLNVSQIEEGRSKYFFFPENFSEILQTVLSNLDGEIKEKKINLTVHQDKNLPAVPLDKQKITLVLWNLLENAVKYTPPAGKVEVNVKLNKKNIEVIIKDNGVGIPVADRKRIFSKFFRASNVVKMQTEGTGLGLFICKNIIEAHKGKISCLSQEGKGTKFSFFLPLTRAKHVKI